MIFFGKNPSLKKKFGSGWVGAGVSDFFTMNPI